MDKTSLASLALRNIGMDGINDITDNNPSAKACLNFWEPARDDVFSESDWPFASVQIPLVLASDTLLDWQYVYAYPVNVAAVWNVFCLGTLKVDVPLAFGPPSVTGTVASKEEQEFETKYSLKLGHRIIGSNNPDAYADVTYIITDPTIWSPKFCFAFAYRLAGLICVSLTGDAEKAKEMLAMASAITNEAKRVSFNERKKKPNNPSGYQAARGG